MPAAFSPLRSVRVVSLALNLPGPAALVRLRNLGARCTKLEPLSGDPMAQYSPQAYELMHESIAVVKADLKTAAGQKRLHQLLRKADVLLTSFRPSALRKLGLGFKKLHALYPALSLVAVVGAPGADAEKPGHDLTYLAKAGLVTGTAMPPSLFADMGGALMASEAVLAAVFQQRTTGKGVHREVALSIAADWLALPRNWGLSSPKGVVGGAHAGYRVYGCINGRVAVAALEPHFAAALCEAVGLPAPSGRSMWLPATHAAIAAFCAQRTSRVLNAFALSKDIPLHTMA